MPDGARNREEAAGAGPGCGPGTASEPKLASGSVSASARSGDGRIFRIHEPTSRILGITSVAGCGPGPAMEERKRGGRSPRRHRRGSYQQDENQRDTLLEDFAAELPEKSPGRRPFVVAPAFR